MYMYMYNAHVHGGGGGGHRLLSAPSFLLLTFACIEVSLHSQYVLYYSLKLMIIL